MTISSVLRLRNKFNELVSQLSQGEDHESSLNDIDALITTLENRHRDKISQYREYSQETGYAAQKRWYLRNKERIAQKNKERKDAILQKALDDYQKIHGEESE